MKKNFTDGFAQYANAADLAQSWIFGVAPILQKRADGVYELRGSAAAPRAVLTHPITPVARAAVSIDVNLPNIAGSFVVGVSPAGYGDRNRGASGNHPKGVYVAVIAGVPRLYYDILTAETGFAVNSLLLAEMDPLVVGRHHIELIVDVSDSVAQARVYINGALASDEIFDRDRLKNGYQMTEIGEVSISTAGTSVAQYPWISNVFSYDPQIADSAPVGPVDITYLSLPDAVLAIGPAADTTGITISDNAWRDFDLSDVSPDAQIIAADLVYRLAAVAGQDPTAAEVAMESGGVQVGATARHDIVPGYGPKLHTVALPATALNPAILNDLTVKIRSEGV